MSFQIESTIRIRKCIHTYITVIDSNWENNEQEIFEYESDEEAHVEPFGPPSLDHFGSIVLL